MAITLKRIAPGDEALLDHVAAGVFDKWVEPGHLAAYLAQPHHHMILALAEDGQVVGKITAMIHHRPDKGPELYIDEIDVAPAWRRRGMAGAMLDAMFKLGKALGCTDAWVGTEADNEAARRLYESRGEVPVAIVMYEYDIQGLIEGTGP